MNSHGLSTTLKKLSKSEGEWVLEVERLVPLGRSLHQPMRQKIEGASLIDKHMRAVPDLDPMADSTLELMNQESGPEVFEIWQGTWMEEAMVHSLSLAKASGGAGGVAAAAGGGASRHAVKKLERLHDNLAERLARVESGDVGELAVQMKNLAELIGHLGARLGTIEDKLGIEAPPMSAAARGAAEAGAAAALASEGSQASSAEVAASSEEEASSAEVAASSEEEVSSAEVAASSEEEASASDAAEEQEAATKQEEEEQAKRPEKRMRPPSAIAMRQSITMLVGEEIGLDERKKPVDLDDGTFFFVKVLDDQDLLVGVMIADLDATVRLSCKLLMLPESEMASQLGSNEASEDSIETMSEIFNTMSATVNNVKSNPHVRTSPLEELNPDDFDWLTTTKRRVDVDVEGGGLLVIASI